MTINWVCIRVRESIRHKISVKSEAPPVETAESCCGGIAPAGAPDAVRYTYIAVMVQLFTIDSTIQGKTGIGKLLLNTYR